MPDPSYPLRLVSSAPSLHNTTLVESATRSVAYAINTEPSTRQTVISRGNAEVVVAIRWPFRSSRDTSVLFAGDSVSLDANEVMFSSNVIGNSTRKFRVAGFAEVFKWKKISRGWQCFAPAHTLLANLHSDPTSGFVIELYDHATRPLTSSSPGTMSPEQSLLDTVILTSLLLTRPSFVRPASISSLTSLSSSHRNTFSPTSSTSSRASHTASIPKSPSPTPDDPIMSSSDPRSAFEIDRQPSLQKKTSARWRDPETIETLRAAVFIGRPPTPASSV